ncbi:MAG: arginase family protein [Gemmataceae bacterium]
MKTQAIFFGFDLFGSAGTAAGAQLLADELREVLADNRRETVRTRARSYTRHVRIEEIEFSTLEELGCWREKGRQRVRALLDDESFLLWCSGNHLGALPVYDELSARGGSSLIVQLDAHLDIHHFRDCATDLSHGNFLLHVDGGPPPVVNIGHRDLLLPADHIARYYQQTFSAADLALEPARVLQQLRQRVQDTEAVYLDLDVDVFDPVYFPAVAQPVPFGLSPAALLGLIEAIGTERLRGLLVSEFDPARDRDDRSLAVLVWLLEYILLRKYETTS